MAIFQDETTGRGALRGAKRWRWMLGVVGISLALTSPLAAKIKAKTSLPAVANIELAATFADTVKAVQEVAADPIVYGTYVYERDKTLTGARSEDISSAFGNDRPQGQVFYKVVNDVIAPRHFKETEDIGTITVRYVVRELSPTSVVLRIDAIFVETAHRAVHASEGAVESAELGKVQEHLNRIQAREREALEDAQAEAEQDAKSGQLIVGQPISPPNRSRATVPTPSPLAANPASALAQARVNPLPASASQDDNAPALATGTVAELEQRVNRLRHQVEAKVKAPGAPLKSAPFHTATTIQTIPADAEVAIVILTTYWYGVQTTDGHTGWIQRSQLESLP